MRVFKSAFLSRYLLVFAFVTYPSAGVPGDALVNLRSFFEHAFRVHFDDPSELGGGHNRKLVPAEPVDTETKRALRPSKSGVYVGPDLSCDDVKLRGYHDWKKRHDIAVRARSEAVDNTLTPEMWLISFFDWNSPAYPVLKVRRTFWGNLKSAKLSVAVLGNDFDIDTVLDQPNEKLSDLTMERVLSINRYNYSGLFESQLAEKNIILLSTTRCDEFSIFNLEIK
jgi:hypothetical protein